MRPVIKSRENIEQKLKDCSEISDLEQIKAQYESLQKPTDSDLDELSAGERDWLDRLEEEIPTTITSLFAQFTAEEQEKEIEKLNTSENNAAFGDSNESDTEESDDVAKPVATSSTVVDAPVAASSTVVDTPVATHTDTDLSPQSPLPVQKPEQQLRAQELQSVSIKLGLIAAKIKRFEDLNDPANEKVLLSLNKVHSEIALHINQFIDGTINRKQFKQSAEQLFDDNTPEMVEIATHRGWKQVFVNFATALAGMFAFYAIAAASKGSWTLFPVTTDSAEKTHQLRDEIAALPDEEQNEAVMQNTAI